MTSYEEAVHQADIQNRIYWYGMLLQEVDDAQKRGRRELQIVRQVVLRYELETKCPQ